MMLPELEIEIPPEFARPLKHPQIGTAGADDIGVGAVDFFPPQGDVFPGLDQLVEPDLGCGVEFADFIEEQDSAGGFFNQSRMTFVGPGEGALGIAERVAGKRSSSLRSMMFTLTNPP